MILFHFEIKLGVQRLECITPAAPGSAIMTFHRRQDRILKPAFLMRVIEPGIPRLFSQFNTKKAGNIRLI